MSWLSESFKSCVYMIQESLHICTMPGASGTNALNLLYPRFMRSLIPFQDIAFICLPYHHYFSSDWSSHEIAYLLAGSHPPFCFRTRHITWLVLSDTCGLFRNRYAYLLIIRYLWLNILGYWFYQALVLKRKKERGTEMTARACGRERGHISHCYQSIFFFFLVVTISQPLILAHIKPMVQFSSVQFDFGCSQCQYFFLCFFFLFLLLCPGPWVKRRMLFPSCWRK